MAVRVFVSQGALRAYKAPKGLYLTESSLCRSSSATSGGRSDKFTWVSLVARVPRYWPACLAFRGTEQNMIGPEVGYTRSLSSSA